jgi:PhnB protein
MLTLIPHLTVSNAGAAIDFYKRAFAATELMRMPAPDGKRLMHAHLSLGNSSFYLNDEFTEYAGDCRHCSAPTTLGGTAVALHVDCPDVDKTFAAAIAAGATVIMPVADMFWGDRYGRLLDPFGHIWSVATKKQNLTPDQMKSAAASAFAAGDKKNQQQQQQQQ